MRGEGSAREGHFCACRAVARVAAGVATGMNIDEADFLDQKSGAAAFMHLRATEDGNLSIGFAVVNHGDLDVTVSIVDARRLGERLLAAAEEIASEH